MYVYDVSGQPRLEKILSKGDHTILSIAWCPTDPNTVAMAVAEAGHNIYLWDIDNQIVTKQLSARTATKFLAW